MILSIAAKIIKQSSLQAFVKRYNTTVKKTIFHQTAGKHINIFNYLKNQNTLKIQIT